MSRVANRVSPSSTGATGNAGQTWLAAQNKKPHGTTAKPKPLAHTGLAHAEKRLSDYARQYEQKAAGKAGVQKAMDWTRKAFNEGYGDDQFKNIGKTKQQLAALKNDVRSGKLSQAQADKASAALLEKFNREEARVTKAQAGNAEVGKAVHGAGRVGVVTLAGLGATAASGGNVFVGIAAAVGAGSLYDAVTVADQGTSSIAPRLDSANSLGGVAARKLKGENVNGGDLARASLGTLTDGVNGAFAGQGMLSGRAAQLGAQKLAAGQASRWALGQATVRVSTLNAIGQTGANTGLQTVGIAADRTLSGKQKKQLAADNALQTLKQLPSQLAFGAVSSHLGVSTQIKSNKALDVAVQFSTDAVSNLAQASAGKLLAGQGAGLNAADVAGAAVQSVTGGVQNIAQRAPARGTQTKQAKAQTANPIAARVQQQLNNPDLQAAVAKSNTSAAVAAANKSIQNMHARGVVTAAAIQPEGTQPAAARSSPTLIVQPDTKLDFKAQSTDGKTLIVVPDTHGRDDLQNKAFDYLRQSQSWVFGDKTTVVSLGDTIDKGPNSAQNVEALIQLPKQEGIQNVVTHMGNHELWLTEWMKHPEKIKYAHDWIANRGGAIALQSYDRFAKAHPEESNFSLDGIDLKNMPVKEVSDARGKSRAEPDNSSGFYSRLYDRMIEGLPKSHLQFFSDLQPSTRIGDYFFSHAGADPKLPLNAQGMGALTWIRDPYLKHEGPWLNEPNTVTISGHTVLAKPLIQSHKFAIDLGTFMTNDFMVAVLRNDLVRFAIFRHGADPMWTDLRDGFDRNLFSPKFDASQVIKNKKPAP
jgi:serine/threonine protein phosphatase 1